MKSFYSREDDKVAQQVREALQAGEEVEWHTKYETFYGCSWAGWAKKQLEGIDCDIKETEYDKWEGYCRTLVITPNPKK